MAKLILSKDELIGIIGKLGEDLSEGKRRWAIREMEKQLKTATGVEHEVKIRPDLETEVERALSGSDKKDRVFQIERKMPFKNLFHSYEPYIMEVINLNYKKIGIRSSAVVATVALVSIMLLSGALAQSNISFSASDIGVSSDDGQIKSATISPEGTFSWEGVDVDVQFDSGDDRISYNIYVKLNDDGNWGLLYSANQNKNIEDEGTTGYDKFVFEGIELSKPNVIAYWQLEANEDGTENVNRIHVKIEAILQTSNVVNGVTKWTDLVSASDTATFNFSCMNEEAIADIGGSINPDAEPTITK